jgi:hypothetical protein
MTTHISAKAENRRIPSFAFRIPFIELMSRGSSHCLREHSHAHITQLLSLHWLNCKIFQPTST